MLCILKVVWPGTEEICDLFAEFIQRTYSDDVWVPSDPGPEHVPDDPHQIRSRVFGGRFSSPHKLILVPNLAATF
jgi:hypothetical protein